MSDSDRESDFESADEGDGGQSDDSVAEKRVEQNMDDSNSIEQLREVLGTDEELSGSVPAGQQLDTGVPEAASVLASVVATVPSSEEIAVSDISDSKIGVEIDGEESSERSELKPLNQQNASDSSRTERGRSLDPVQQVDENQNSDAVQNDPSESRPEETHRLSAIPDPHRGDPFQDGREGGGAQLEQSADREAPVKTEPATRKFEQRSSSIERSVFDKLNQAAESRQNQSSSWGSWGASLLSTATSSVATFTNQVGQGFSSVIEGVEATLGAPSPQELAAHIRKIEKENEETVERAEYTERPTNAPLSEIHEPTQSSQSGLPLSLGNLVSGVGTLTSAIEQAGSKALSGGLDTLEMIGRKTMDVLQEGDPGLKKKRSFLGSVKPSLSDVLKEVQEKAKLEKVQENQIEKQVHFGSVFDECQGLVHIEALEMLSKQCKQKVEVALLSLDEEEVSDKQTDLLQFKEACLWDEVDDVDENTDHDFAAAAAECLKRLRLPDSVNADALMKIQQEERNWLTECQAEQHKGEQKDPQVLHTRAITCLATFTAAAIKIIHKISEIILILEEGDALKEISSLSKLMNVFCMEVAILSAKFSSCLIVAADDSEDPDACSPMITNVYLEASNSNTYIQDAFELVVPIFQLKYVNQK